VRALPALSAARAAGLVQLNSDTAWLRFAQAVDPRAARAVGSQSTCTMRWSSASSDQSTPMEASAEAWRAARSAIIQANGIADPNQFFQTLLTKPYLKNVVISPHFYPPSISQQTQKCAPAPCTLARSCLGPSATCPLA